MISYGVQVVGETILLVLVLAAAVLSGYQFFTEGSQGDKQ